MKITLMLQKQLRLCESDYKTATDLNTFAKTFQNMNLILFLSTKDIKGFDHPKYYLEPYLG